MSNTGLRRRFQTPSPADHRILQLHAAMVDKIIAQPELIDQIKVTLDNRLEMGKIRHGGHLTWHCILELITHPRAFKEAVLADTPHMRRLRRKTPFVGILTEEERQNALIGS